LIFCFFFIKEKEKVNTANHQNNYHIQLLLKPQPTAFISPKRNPSPRKARKPRASSQWLLEPVCAQEYGAAPASVQGRLFFLDFFVLFHQGKRTKQIAKNLKVSTKPY
jgi:hypothetical protein